MEWIAPFWMLKVCDFFLSLQSLENFPFDKEFIMVWFLFFCTEDGVQVLVHAWKVLYIEIYLQTQL
jgi:hypothetical protein